MGKFSKQQVQSTPAQKKSTESNYLLIGVGAIIVLALVWFFFLGKPAYPVIDSPRPIFGNPDAKIVVEEFSDFECPACQTAHPYIKTIVEEFKDDIRFEYKHFPLNNECNNEVPGVIHPNACIAAYASECANDQNEFFTYSNYLFTTKKVDEASLKAAASTLKLNTESFNACLDSRAKRDVVIADVAQGNTRNVNATPTLFVNGQKVENWNNLRSIILAQKATLGK